MSLKRYTLFVAALLLIAGWWTTMTVSAATDDQAEIRGVVRQVFEQLKSRQYSALYDVLPAASQRRISRDRFTRALERTSDMYELERIEIGAVRVSGDIAVVETTMYGRVSRPIESDGKVAAQQYLIREDGRWRVVVGDRATVQSLLADYPGFTRKYPVRNPRIYVRRDGRWVDVSAMARRRVAGTR